MDSSLSKTYSWIGLIPTSSWLPHQRGWFIRYFFVLNIRDITVGGEKLLTFSVIHPWLQHDLTICQVQATSTGLFSLILATFFVLCRKIRFQDLSSHPHAMKFHVEIWRTTLNKSIARPLEVFITSLRIIYSHGFRAPMKHKNAPTKVIQIIDMPRVSKPHSFRCPLRLDCSAANAPQAVSPRF